eukprot:4621518-Pyramimonas_sp.AAC.2
MRDSDEASWKRRPPGDDDATDYNYGLSPIRSEESDDGESFAGGTKIDPAALDDPEVQAACGLAVMEALQDLGINCHGRVDVLRAQQEATHHGGCYHIRLLLLRVEYDHEETLTSQRVE